MACVLAFSGPAAASYYSAAWLFGLTRRAPHVPHLSAVTTSTKRDRMIGHPVRSLDEVMVVRNVPVTSVERTLLDVGDVIGDRVRPMFDEALRLRLTTIDELQRRAGERYGSNRPAGGVFVAAVEQLLPPMMNPNEARALRVILKAGLPMPKRHHWLNLGERWYQADFAWPERKLGVEADSSYHSGSAAVDHDAEREQRLVAIGWEILHFTRDEWLRRPTWAGDRIWAAYDGRLPLLG